MATTTTDITIDPDSWTELAGGASATSGFFTVFGDSAIIYRQGTVAPDDSVTTGHWLEPASDAVRFDLLATEKAYARSRVVPANIIITLDG